MLEDGCGFIKEIPLNGHIFDLLSYGDIRNICGVYVVDFLLTSQKTKRGGKK
jgi:hypothetical protein